MLLLDVHTELGTDGPDDLYLQPNQIPTTLFESLNTVPAGAYIFSSQVCVNLDIKSLGAASFMKFILILDISVLVMPIAFA